MNTTTVQPQVNQMTLYYREGTSDKVYQASIEPAGDLFVVNVAYGRRGGTMTTGTKTTVPVYEANARRIFDKLIKEKMAKGYTPGADGKPFHYPNGEQNATGILPQLRNPIEEEQALQLMQNPEWCLQEKKDGRRLLLKKEGDSILGINRKGLVIGLASSIIKSASDIADDFLLDGECVGDVLYAFDLLQRGTEKLLVQPYQIRLHSLIDLLDYSAHTHIELIETAYEATEKVAFLQTCRREKREGVVFKRLDAPYTPGRPNSGGTQLKYKFYATLSAMVGKINEQRSVELRLYKDNQWVTAGNVTIPSNERIPIAGAVVEIRYLYAFTESGALYQPTYLGLRPDVAPMECVTSQLKYKPSEEDEA